MRYLLLLGAMLGILALAPPASAAETVPLEVITALPQGKVEGEVRTLTIIFNKPMVPLEALQASGAAVPVQIRPRMAGQFQWINESTLIFIPQGPFPRATSFTVTVPVSLAALDGSTLKTSYSWSFETPRPRVISIEPPSGALGVDPQVRPFIRFNQPVNPEEIKSFIHLVDTGDSLLNKMAKLFNKKGVNLPFTLNQPNPGEWKKRYPGLQYGAGVEIVPKKALGIGSTYKIVVDKGIKGISGGLGSEMAFESQFITAGVFRFAGIGNQNIKPNEPLILRFTSPVATDPANLKTHILFDPPIDPDAFANNYPRLWGGELALYALPLEAGTDYKVTLKRGLKDNYGNTLPQDVTATFHVGYYDPYFDFREGVGILESYNKWFVPVEVMNISALELRKARVTLDQVIPLYNANWQDQYKAFTYGWQVNKLWKPEVPPNKAQTLPIDLKEVIPTGDTGIALIELHWPEKKDWWPPYPKGLYQVTNVGITAKFAPESTLIWATRLKDAAPLSKAKVELRNDKNEILWTGETDGKGFVQGPGLQTLKISGDYYGHGRLWVLVRHAEGEAFIASDWQWGIEPYRFNLAADWNPSQNKVKTFLFTERGLYRPGEEVKIKGILKEEKAGAWVAPAIKQGTLRIYDPQNQEVFSQEVTLSENGSFDLAYQLKENSPPNDYRITFTPRGAAVSSAGFKVANFRPAAFRVETKADKDSYIDGDKPQVNIRASYLFGAPLKGGTAKWSLTRSRDYFYPPGYEGYFFGSSWYWYDDEDDYYEYSDATTIGSGEGELDENGEYVIPDLTLSVDRPGRTYSYTLEGSVRDNSYQTLSSRANFRVHPGEFYIGLNPDSTFLTAKEPYRVRVVAVTPQGEKVKGKQVSVKVTRRWWTSAWKQTLSGYRWVSEYKEEVLDEKRITSASEPVAVTFDPKVAGYYIVTAQSKDDRGHEIKTSSYLYVTGHDYVGWRMEDTDRIELIPDKTGYKPGDTARIMVKSPYAESDAIVTVEREGVLDHWTVHLKGTADSITVPLKESYLPNVYVGVLLLQGRAGEQKFDEEGNDLGKPAFKVGYLNLSVSPESKRLKVEAIPSKETYRPGEEVELSVRTTTPDGKGKPAEVTLAVADVGVLSLINYPTPDPFSYFFAPRPLSVLTGELRHHIIGQRVYGEKGKMGGEGGWEGEGLSFMVRKDFRYTAFWLPSLMTGEDGSGTAKFTLPDSLTAYRIMAVAHSKDGMFGSSDHEIKTNKPLMIRSALPRFIRVGESFRGGALVHNESDRPMKIAIKAEAEGIALAGDGLRTISLAPHTSQRVDFTYQAPPKTGTAKFSLYALETEGPGEPEKDAMTIAIPILQTKPTETVAFYGTSEKPVRQQVRIPEGEGNLNVQLTSTALSGLSGSVEYLFGYPYGCLEQKMSRALPMILFADAVSSFNLPILKDADYRQVVQKTLDEVPNYQRYDGGFNIWPGNEGGSEPYITVYTLFGMKEAQKKGYQIDKAVYYKGINYLQQFLRVDQHRVYRDDELDATKAFALWILAEEGRYDAGYAQHLYDQRNKMPFFGRALLLKALDTGKGPDYMKAELKKELMNGMVQMGGLAYVEEPGSYFSWWIFSSNARSTAMVLQALLETEGKFGAAPSMARWLTEKAEGGQWRTTQENLFVFWALGTYFQVYESTVPNYTVKVKPGQAKPFDAAFKNRTFKVESNSWPLADFTPNTVVPVQMDKEGPGAMYYRLALKYVPKAPSSPRNGGIGIERSFFTMDNKAVTDGKFKLGEMYRVQINLDMTQESAYLAMECPIPAGFEVVDTSLSTETQRQAREDGDYGYSDYWWWYAKFNRSEIWDDRVVVFSNRLPEGKSTYSFLVRATTAGRFEIPPDQAELMYYPEIFGRSQGMRVEVR